ncbi:hybrid sensor histidine kinase/response regulator [Nostoc sp. UHCC 0870]|uniref:hybrid sensor histidine kinase/response regulator n=1 Tax=Nostoc sp. UHCC 0870 TaxID=2914041 RepID=UPI001EDE3358|nr:ATP-binding protein [Nostoc sp. UHCC 0870]UKO96023.1 response regulator [Nostoc sp. UHCC 0870]
MFSISSDTQKFKTIRILVVEDEYILAINLQETLESLGYKVVDIADTAELAIAKATELSPNLILMDIRLRGETDGIQAAEQIWNTLQIPIIYVTGHSDKSTVERATFTFPFGYILKPVRDQELYVAIQTALNRYEHEQFLSSVLRGMGDGVIVVDAQLHIKYMNQVAEALTGWQLNQAKDQIVTEILQLIDEKTLQSAPNPLFSAIQQATTIYLGSDILLSTKDGTSIPIADSATCLRDHNGLITGGVMVFRDDTQRRLAEESNLAAERSRQLELQMVEMQRINQLKEDFLATTSHEMRSPLSNIKMAISTLKDILNQQNIFKAFSPDAFESTFHYLNILYYECERELNLVDDLLSMRIMDAESYPLELTLIQVQEWLPQLVESFQDITQNQKQILKVTVPPDLPSLVSDLGLLTRIMSELLTNACKYTPPFGHITVTVHFTQNPKNLRNQDNPVDGDEFHLLPSLQITVNNSGVDIPTQEQSHIFEPFYQISQNTTKDQLSIFDASYQLPQGDSWQDSGTGLGLALVKKLVEYLQGTIEVKSGNGLTSFTIQLPLRFSK